jgi:hypothetical protein
MEESADFWWVGRHQASSAHFIFWKAETERKKRTLDEAGGGAEVEVAEDTRNLKKNAPSALFAFWDLVTEAVRGVEKISYECSPNKKHSKDTTRRKKKERREKHQGRGALAGADAAMRVLVYCCSGYCRLM